MTFPVQRLITAEGVVGLGGHMTPFVVKRARRGSVAAVVGHNLLTRCSIDQFSIECLMKSAFASVLLYFSL